MIGKTVIFLVSSPPPILLDIYFSLYYIYTIRTNRFFTNSHTYYGNTRAIITFLDVKRQEVEEQCITECWRCFFFLLQFQYAPIAWKKMKRQYFFSASLHINYRCNAGFWREKNTEWRDPDNEVFTIFTVENWNIAIDHTTACVSHLRI